MGTKMGGYLKKIKKIYKFYNNELKKGENQINSIVCLWTQSNYENDAPIWTDVTMLNHYSGKIYFYF